MCIRDSVYSCGYGSLGQLGIKATTNQCEPQLVYSLTNKKVIQIAAGWNHSIVLTESFDLYTCGHGLYGQLGHGDEESRTSFTHVTQMAGKNIDKVYAGGNHSWVTLDIDQPLICLLYTSPSPRDS
eukprot:TRINITY_DN5500_c0_g1_i2.p2 TRINITY_DN5500_c0_g1~~TRINITY_DN5500_c0_g1_i2.p2  ORF type:complete len:126 (-),score=27.52 TRINITY_DN5500_c0_g1_i2:37-414(-)